MKKIKVSGQNEIFFLKLYIVLLFKGRNQNTTYVCLINLSFLSSLRYFQNPLVKLKI